MLSAIRFAIEVQRPHEKISKLADLSHILHQARETRRSIEKFASLSNIRPHLQPALDARRSIEKFAKQVDLLYPYQSVRRRIL
ncbi:hypothetical protein MYX64_01785 [Nitrospinae bacterium AH_259_B05_G02_I21]|nr:hypothetical protein [Nitrospinae bacterium AH_259_B05_G02_I21]